MAKKRYNIDMLSKKGLRMNKLTSLDLTNLRFLMNSDPQTLQEFYESASDEDIDYALELIRYAKQENARKVLEVVDAYVGESAQYPEANAVLAKFRLK